MSPPERFAPDDPREWLNRARSNLAMAKSHIPGAYLEDLCFEAQQAAEKAIKAVMISRGIDFPYVHDLGNLLALLDANGETIPESIDIAMSLTTYATTTRYPTTSGAPWRSARIEKRLPSPKPWSDGRRSGCDPAQARTGRAHRCSDLPEDRVTTVPKHMPRQRVVTEKPTLGMLAAGNRVKTVVSASVRSMPRDIGANCVRAPGPSESRTEPPAERLL